MDILIVDDSLPNMLVYKGIVRNLTGCTAICHTSSAEALAWCATNHPDVLLVDYDMPPPNGLQFIKSFRSMRGNAEIPILMITAETDKALRYKALETGANDFLNKPVDVIEFSARVHNMVELRRSRKDLEYRAGWLEGEVRKATAEIIGRERETIWRLARVAEFRDTETGTHIIRMAQYCKAIAKPLGLSAADQELLLMAAPMHDIGKVAIPDSILLKPGKLDAAEFDMMKTHTTIGHEILKDSASQLLRSAAEIALTHHERYDGSGYPSGLAGDDIPLFGRICALSDVFDALTSVRPYKPAYPIDDAIAEIIHGAGEQFDPKLVEAFEAALPQIRRLKEEYSDEAQRLKPVRHDYVAH
jgi:putative two-component system response regulator